MTSIIKFIAFLLTVIIVFYSCKKIKLSENKPPIAVALFDQTITLPTDSVSLNGNSSSHPDGRISEWLWKKISGPASYSIADAAKSEIVVKNLVQGIYQVELKVTDDRGLSARDTVQITVIDSGFIRINLISIGTLLPAKFFIATATNGNKIYFAGGSNGELGAAIQVFSTVNVYDFSTNTWSKTNLSEARAGIGAVSVANKIVFIGGAKNFNYYDGWYDLTKRTDVYDVNTNSWMTTESPEEELFLSDYGVTAGSLNQAFSFSGYWYYNEFVPYVHIYNVLNNTWITERLSENYNKTGVATASFPDKILFAGGELMAFPQPRATKIVDIYNISTNTWSIDSLSLPRSSATSVVFNNKAYFAGGVFDPQGSFSFSDRVDIYDNITGSWTIQNLSYPALLLGAAVYDQKILFFHWDKVVDIFDSNTNLWSRGLLPISLANAKIISAGGNVYIVNNGDVWKIQM